MDSLEETTTKISSNGSSSNLANSSISLSGQNMLDEEETKEIVDHLHSLDQIFHNSPNKEYYKNIFVEREGLTLLVMLFEDASFENNTLAHILIQIWSSLAETSEDVSALLTFRTTSSGLKECVPVDCSNTYSQ